jgi:hypothetical protein
MLDSEYSWRTGNLNEFVLERVALYEDLHVRAADDTELNFFLTYIAEDIALGYSFGHNLAEVTVPPRVYQRRLETNPLFVQNTKVIGNDAKFEHQNPFNLLEKKTSSQVKSFLAKFAKDSSIVAIKRDFKVFSSDSSYHHDEEDTTLTSKQATGKHMRIFLKVLEKSDIKRNQDANLKAYEKLLASVEASRNNLVGLIKVTKKAYAQSKSMLKDLVLTKKDSKGGDEPLKLSYNVKVLLREHNTKDTSMEINRKLALKSNKAVYALGILDMIQDTALVKLQTFSLVTQLPATMVTDIVKVVNQCQILEECIIKTCVEQDKPTCIEQFSETMELKATLSYYLNDKKYPKEIFEDHLADSSLTRRLDTIRSTIYASYNKTKLLSRRIWQMKKSMQNN